MKVTHMKDGGVIVEPETAEEKRIHEIGVWACIDAIRAEMTPDALREHREYGADPGDFRDLGLEEAYNAMEEEVGNILDGDAISAVCCDPRVTAALAEFDKALTETEE